MSEFIQKQERRIPRHHQNFSKKKSAEEELMEEYLQAQARKKAVKKAFEPIQMRGKRALLSNIHQMRNPDLLLNFLT